MHSVTHCAKKTSKRKTGNISRCGSVAVLCIAAIMRISMAQPPAYAVDGTTGAPLGGIGSGAVKFKAHDGTFTGTMITPCAIENFSATSMTGTQFQLYTKRGSTILTSSPMKAMVTGGRADDDAIYPVHFVNFGTTNEVGVSLTAFSPWNTAEVDQMSYPYAFFQFTLANKAATAAEVAVAFQVKTNSAPSNVAGKGFKTASGQEWSVYASADGADGVITTGNDNGFMTSGQCNNMPGGTLNRVAVKVALAANQTRTIKFVLAWFNGAENATYPNRYYYKNAFAGSNAVADFGLTHFDALRDNALALVTRMRASTVPYWLVDHCLVSLSLLTNNGMYMKDGRYAHTEGMWNTNGTMDQMWHARQIYAQLLPGLNWQELQYWARTQKTNPDGQIHHDLGEHYDMWYLCAWDDRQHTDYRDIDAWVDLNCGYIISVYETFIATDNHERLDYFWPSVKKAAQRILNQVTMYGSSTYQGTFESSQSSYDYGGNSNPYNSSLTIPTYKIMSVLAELKGETALKQTYDQAYTRIVDSFKRRYLTNNFTAGRLCEGYMVGQWTGFFLKQGAYFDNASIDYSLTTMNNYYSPLTQGLGYTGGTFDEWSIYIIGHLAGLNLQTGKLAEWRAFQYDFYERNFKDRNLVYNQELGIPRKSANATYLASSTAGFNHYLSLPVIWRNYYDIVGYQRNKHTGELWMEPIMLPEMNHSFANALVVSPEGYSTVSCIESGTGFQTQTITFKPDNPMAVTNVYLKDKGLSTVYVSIDDASYMPERVGSGYGKELKIAYNKTIPSAGARIVVSDQPVSSVEAVSHGRIGSSVFAQAGGKFTVRLLGTGLHCVEVYSMSGTLVSRNSFAGPRSYSLTASEGGMAPGMYCVTVQSEGKIQSRTFLLSR